jgi:transposase-like protein
VRFWWHRFGHIFAAEIRRKRVLKLCAYSNWQWHLDVVFVKIDGETNADRKETGRWLNNRAENSHLPFRRRERAMQRFRRIRSLQKFTAVHSSVHNLFNLKRHLHSRHNFKLNRAAALSEWRVLGAA